MEGVAESLNAEFGVKGAAGFNTSIRESMPAPAFSYDFVCMGPDEESRAEYLRILAMAESMQNAGKFHAAARLREEAEGMVKEKWRETIHNLVTTEGKNDILDKYFKGSSYTAAWYLGLKGTGSAAAGDTLASHGGWSEVTPYSGNRPAITFGTTSSGSNTASAVSYTINATATVAGAFVSSVNTGTSGKLYSAGDFAVSRGVASGDTLNVTPTVTMS